MNTKPASSSLSDAEHISSITDAQTSAAVAALESRRAAEAEMSVLSFPSGPDNRVLYLVPKNRTLADLEEFHPTPYRAKGDRPVNDAASFLKLLQSHIGAPERRVYLSASNLRVQAILNDESALTPGWRDHTITWNLKKHRDLIAWENLVGKGAISQVNLLEFLDDRLADIQEPSQGRVLSVISDLNITTDAKFQSRRDLRSGSFILHCDQENKPDVEVPEKIEIGIPIFDGLDLAFRIPLRLRYEVREGRLAFRLNFLTLEAVMASAWEKATADVIQGLGGIEFINIP